MHLPIRVCALLAAQVAAVAAPSGRTTVSLDGVWRVADSVAGDAVPTEFDHAVPVPGLTRLASPGFADVDRFDSRELIANLIAKKRLPESARTSAVGVPHQIRNYFWYATEFHPPERRQVALLRIAKAQFGTAVWLNGRPLGEHAGCFTAGTFNLTPAVNWNGKNTLVVRIGAHPAAMPRGVPSGADQEKTLWTPGIYDSVTLILCDNPVIETVQIAPHVSPREIVVQTTLRNYGAGVAAGELSTRVSEWHGRSGLAAPPQRHYALEPGAMQTITATIPLPAAHLWSPSDPFLHQVELRTNGDAKTVRFGIREFRSDVAHHRFLLNGRPIFLRGSNITLHRFFEDSQCGSRPWDEAWLRRLLVDIPHQMNWNAFRFCIGPVPERWLDIADEAGLLIQQEYFIWTGPKPGNFPREWSNASLTREFSEFLRDNWNHPSVVMWDACNETVAPALAGVINAVRRLDLSHRPWDNGYNPPAGPDDFVETHPYERWRDLKETTLIQTELTRGDQLGYKTPRTSLPVLVNEYGWLWLNRDGTPTLLTDPLYAAFVGKDATAEQRFAFDAYYLAALTEYWRAYRRVAGVLHFVYLTSSYPGAFTADHFRDVPSLTLEPHFADYMGQAFKPLGVYVNLWRRKLAAGTVEELPVMLVNDHDFAVTGDLAVVVRDESAASVATVTLPFSLAPLGAQTLPVKIHLPARLGHYHLTASAGAHPALPGGPTRSRREFEVVAPADVPAIPPLPAAIP